MSAWMCCPSKRPPVEAERVFTLWLKRGYRIALWREDGSPMICDLMLGGEYPGYAVAQNELIKTILEFDPHCDWIVSAADDIDPDLNHTAHDIAQQCEAHFGRAEADAGLVPIGKPARWSTYGVMQPTGDRWGDRQGAYIDRVAGSPWIGREFARRVYGGRGPYWPEYRHMFVDEELRAVAIKLDVYWERRDLIHLHRHWGRPRDGETIAPISRMPEFLTEANSPEHWARYKRIFAERQAAGFPGHEPSDL